MGFAVLLAVVVVCVAVVVAVAAAELQWQSNPLLGPQEPPVHVLMDNFTPKLLVA